MDACCGGTKNRKRSAVACCFKEGGFLRAGNIQADETEVRSKPCVKLWKERLSSARGLGKVDARRM